MLKDPYKNHQSSAENSDAEIYQTLVRLLAAREHSRNELERKLSQRGFAASDIARQLDDVAKNGIQSDQRYAEMALRSAVAKGHGLNRLTQQLSQHNIDVSMATDVDEHATIDWFELALNVKIKKFGEEIESDWQKRQKQQRFLLNRGFSFEQINYAVSHDPSLTGPR